MAGDSDDINMSAEKPSCVDRMRNIVKSYIDRRQYHSALFWADKVVSLSKDEVSDLYWKAHTLYLTGQFHRAAHLIKTNKLDKRFLSGRYLAAQCHFECREYKEALDVLDQADNYQIGTKVTPVNVEEQHPLIPCDKIESCLHLLRGQVYEALENRSLAMECFREALRQDVYCYQALDSLVTHHMMTAQEEKELLESLPYSQQCSDEDLELLTFLYENKLKKYHKPCLLKVPTSVSCLQTNCDVTVNLAERHFYNCDFRGCYAVTTRVLAQDPFDENCLPLHISVLVELKKANELFYLAHRLVDVYPTKPVAWFAVGCYYLLVGKNEPARRYLEKATSLERTFGPAWLAFGHSFAADSEHDQAMAAYFTAAQIMKGCHLPVLYIGLEYGITNNVKLAERFFGQALSIAPEDPFVLHEMGTVAFQNLDFEEAEKYFRSALEMIRVVEQEVIADKWEPLLNNLGHVCRKLKKYDDALTFHRQALILSPQSASTYSALGYVYALTGRCMEAVDHFHKALGIRRDDTFTTTMLGYTTEQLMAECTQSQYGVDVPASPFVGALDALKLKTGDLEDTTTTLGDVDQDESDRKLSCDSHTSLPNSSMDGEVSMADTSGNMAIDTDDMEGD